MNELQRGRMERNPGDSTLGSLVRAVFSVADDRVAERCKLHSDLILQSRQQRNAYQRSSTKRALDGIPEFSPRRFGVPLRAQLLIHSLSSKIVNQYSLFRGQMPANYGQIMPHGSMREKLPDQRLSITQGLGEQQNSGRETIDAMYHQSLLSLSPQVLRQKR
jgi:hypothetical protein